MHPPVTRVLVRLSVSYVCVIALSIVVFAFLPTFEEVGHLEKGCYVTDALVVGAKCRGFIGSGIIEFAINLPLSLIYLPLFGFAGVLTLEPKALGATALGIALWLPLIYLARYVLRNRHNKNNHP